MSFVNITVGDKLDIKVQFRNMGEIVYTSKVLDILDKRNNILSVYQPARGDQLLDMLQGREYEVTVYTKQAMLVFKGYFEGFVKDGENYFVALRLSNDGYRVQRREFFRFSCNIDMKYSIIEGEAEEEENEDLYSAIIQTVRLDQLGETFEGIIKDIGGGGLRFVTDKEMDLRNPIRCEFILGDNHMVLKGQVLEKQFLPKTTHKFQYRVIFTGIPLEQQEEIVKYIFDEQKKQRRVVGNVPQ
ncbi:MAG: flagellar brake protein [Defluviitaleaceae bacterium]|nr:flagellar brake protein [Defluviitaleaceae bacterium]